MSAFSSLLRASRNFLCVLLCALLAVPLRAASFADMTIEQLMNESITSVSKKETSLGESPAAVAVVTADDIRRLGATTLAESLRFVPGLDVARISASQWAISSRGFNYLYENKLLVLMDGRSIYTPTFGGVYWDVADTFMEDIDRIEVVRGPGATLWGANAVNGVINVITKRAKDTQGVLASATAGTLDGVAGSVRVGGRLGEKMFYRTYVKAFDRNATVDDRGHDAGDKWTGAQAGFRLDGDLSHDSRFTVQGDYHTSTTREHAQDVLLTPPFVHESVVSGRNHGTNVLGRWTHQFSATSSLSLQGYVEHSHHSDANTNPSQDTVDLELQHRFAVATRHDIVWGLGHRYHNDRIPASSLVIWTPEQRTTHLTTAFVQDQISLRPHRLSLILGSKFEHDELNGVKTQPSARLLSTPSATETIWASVSHAFKTPARFDTDARLNLVPFQPPGSPPIQLALVGNSRVRVEEVEAYELGYRLQPSPRWSVDFAVFYNQYNNLISYTEGAPQFQVAPVPHVFIPLVGGNEQSAHTFGSEFTVQWRPLDHWRLSASYTWLQARVRPDPGVEGDSPKHQVHLRSYLELSPRWELNAAASYVGALTNSMTYNHVPAYVRFDLGLVWHPTPAFEIGIWGQNLLDPHHPEFTPLNTSFRGEIPRSIMTRATWRF